MLSIHRSKLHSIILNDSWPASAIFWNFVDIPCPTAMKQISIPFKRKHRCVASEFKFCFPCLFTKKFTEFITTSCAALCTVLSETNAVLLPAAKKHLPLTWCAQDAPVTLHRSYHKVWTLIRPFTSISCQCDSCWNTCTINMSMQYSCLNAFQSRWINNCLGYVTTRTDYMSYKSLHWLATEPWLSPSFSMMLKHFKSVSVNTWKA